MSQLPHFTVELEFSLYPLLNRGKNDPLSGQKTLEQGGNPML